MNAIADLEYAIAKTTENIRMTGLAQQIRRERKAMVAKLEGLTS